MELLLKFFILALLFDLVIIAALFAYNDRPRRRNRSTGPTVRLHGSGAYGIAVLGVSSYRSVLERAYGDDAGKWNGKKVQAVLVPEDARRRANKTMRVELDGRTVGFLAGSPAKDCYRRIRQSRYPQARIVCNAVIMAQPRPGTGGYTGFEVRLDLPPAFAPNGLRDAASRRLRLTFPQRAPTARCARALPRSRTTDLPVSSRLAHRSDAG